MRYRNETDNMGKELITIRKEKWWKFHWNEMKAERKKGERLVGLKIRKKYDSKSSW